MRIKIGPFVINIFEPSGWAFDTSCGLDIAISVAHVLSAGGGGGTLTVKQSRKGLPNTGKRYALKYGECFASAGTPWPAAVTFSGSLEAFPSGPLWGWPIFRLPGSPGPSGEGGKPSGFAGHFAMVTPSANFTFGGGLTVLLLGGFTRIGPFRYYTPIYGATVASLIGAGISCAMGLMQEPEMRSD